MELVVACSNSISALKEDAVGELVTGVENHPEQVRAILGVAFVADQVAVVALTVSADRQAATEVVDLGGGRGEAVFGGQRLVFWNREFAPRALEFVRENGDRAFEFRDAIFLGGGLVDRIGGGEPRGAKESERGNQPTSDRWRPPLAQIHPHTHFSSSRVLY